MTRRTPTGDEVNEHALAAHLGRPRLRARWTDEDCDELASVVDEIAAAMWIIHGGDYRMIAGRAHELRLRKQKEKSDGKADDDNKQ